MTVNHITRRSLLKLAGAIALANMKPSASCPAAIPEPIKESRAIFDEGLHWADRKGAERVCSRIKSAGFNVFMPCVWHGRGTTWPSQLAPWDTKLPPTPNYDPLARLVETAKRFDIEVHPWFTVARREREFFSQFYEKGTPPESFDVHNDTFRAFVTDLILEVVRNYDIQGVNLDYIRAGGVCESRSCITDYKSQTGRNLLADAKMRMIPTLTLKELFEWQEAAITDIVRSVSQGARSIKPNIVISVDAHPGHRVDEVQGRNSLRWADEGLVDVVYMMHYEASPDWEMLKTFQRRLQRPEALVVLCGNYDRLGETNASAISRSGSHLNQLLAGARAYQAGNGVGLYLYGRLSDEQISSLKASVFQMPAVPQWCRGVGAKNNQSRDVELKAPIVQIR
jgi:uncharacterized lipoprotein YddW (UPF0748 family)